MLGRVAPPAARKRACRLQFLITMKSKSKSKSKSELPVIRRWLDRLVLRWRRSRMKVTSITLKRSGIWTEVWVTVDGRETFLVREVYENEFHHSITSTGIVGCRYDSQNSPSKINETNPRSLRPTHQHERNYEYLTLL